MLVCRDPAEAYRRAAFDLRVSGSDVHALTALCFEEAIAAVNRACYAHLHGHTLLRGRAMARARSALTALKAGVDITHPMGEPLLTIYDAADAAIVHSMSHFDRDAMIRVSDDLQEIAGALAQAARNMA
ncbi:flagellar protein FliS [Croceicoccus sp. YJ47]|uniref:flagellar protein FliS n=1 Tax=Croceicoccus sp. YJ47 TaxID=2798724 RepID=UPI001920C615|nr:flagellar protein FliS [Croceicoccus sp. YJ47]QQN75497.1 flagellar protein FliS [Croceicoccus sp. YJ47]